MINISFAAEILQHYYGRGKALWRYLSMLVVQQTTWINLSLSLKWDFCTTDCCICNLEKLFKFFQKISIGHELNLSYMYTNIVFTWNIEKYILNGYLGCITVGHFCWIFLVKLCLCFLTNCLCKLIYSILVQKGKQYISYAWKISSYW